MRSSPLSRRGLAARALALAPVCAIALGGLLAAPAGASVTGAVPGAIMRVMPDGTLTPLPSAHVIKPTITAAGIRSYDVTSPGLLSGIHACADIGNDGTYHAILCADMWAAPEDNGPEESPRHRHVGAAPPRERADLEHLPVLERQQSP